MLDGYLGSEGCPGPLDFIGPSAQSPSSCSVPRETTCLMNLEKAPLCAPGGVLRSAGHAHARVWRAWVYVCSHGGGGCLSGIQPCQERPEKSE